MFYPAAEFLVTTRITRVEGEPFKSEGKVLVKPAGWRFTARKPQSEGRAAEARAGAAERDRSRPQSRGQAAPDQTAAALHGSTLLRAMEGAGKLVDDEELREAMSEQGPRHAGHARGDHRRFDRRKICASARPRTGADRQGVLADAVCSDGLGSQRIDPAGNDRRLGIQAQANGARATAARASS